MKTAPTGAYELKARYASLITELRAIENARGLYLSDELVDRENVMDSDAAPSEYSPEYWGAMYRAACSAAGGRAEEYGLDINALVGRVIY